jgi:hypothetical protein
MPTFIHADWADAFARLNVGSDSAARAAKIAITTNSSIKVKPRAAAP